MLAEKHLRYFALGNKVPRPPDAAEADAEVYLAKAAQVRPFRGAHPPAARATVAELQRTKAGPSSRRSTPPACRRTPRATPRLVAARGQRGPQGQTAPPRASRVLHSRLPGGDRFPAARKPSPPWAPSALRPSRSLSCSPQPPRLRPIRRRRGATCLPAASQSQAPGAVAAAADRSCADARQPADAAAPCAHQCSPQHKSEQQPSSVPGYNPLKRRHMAMPVLPGEDGSALAF